MTVHDITARLRAKQLHQRIRGANNDLYRCIKDLVRLLDAAEDAGIAEELGYPSFANYLAKGVGMQRGFSIYRFTQLITKAKRANRIRRTA